MLTSFPPSCSVEWMVLESGLEGCCHSLCSPQNRLDLGLLADWCFRTPPLIITAAATTCLSKVPKSPPPPRLPQQEVSPEGEVCKLKSQTQVSWVLRQISTPPRFKELVRKHCFDMRCFYCCCNVIISKCPRRRKKGCEVNKREKSFAAKKL